MIDVDDKLAIDYDKHSTTPNLSDLDFHAPPFTPSPLPWLALDRDRRNLRKKKLQ